MMKLLKWVIWAVVAATAILVLCGVYVAGLDYDSYFDSAKGNLVDTRTAIFETDSLFRHEWLSLHSDKGLKVECGLLIPVNIDGGRRYPVVVLMGGKTTGKHAIDYALDIRDVIIVAPDYPYAPKESYSVAQFLSDVPEMRRAALSVVPSVMLVIDYLFQRSDVDTSKLVLLGYSFGAPFVPCIAARDRRAAIAAVVFGGGDLRGLIRHNVRRYAGPLTSDFVSLLAAALLRPLEPLRYADRISPIPLLMINGSEDEQVPPRYAFELYSKARQPKAMVWLPAHHVNPRNVDLTRRIVTTLKVELTKRGVLSKQN